MGELSAVEMHEILALRQNIFIVEQTCLYQDADEMDYHALHLTGRLVDSGRIITYLRLCPPGTRFAQVSIGRLLCDRENRGKGLAQHAMQMAIVKSEECYPRQGIKISAQYHLLDFYRRFGFRPEGDQYDEDGIPHIAMLLE